MASRNEEFEDTKGIIGTGMRDNKKEQKTKTLHRTDLATQAPLNSGTERRCFERDSSSCSTYDTRHVTVKRHEHHLIWK
jgi:hypothetical protein